MGGQRGVESSIGGSSEAIDLSRHSKVDRSCEVLSNTTPFSCFLDKSRPLTFDLNTFDLNTNHRGEGPAEGDRFLTCTTITERALSQLVDDVLVTLGNDQVYRFPGEDRFVV